MTRKQRWLAAIGLLVLVTAVYAPTAGFDFVNLDDPEYITENPYVRAGLTEQSVHWAATAFHSGHWHPLTWLSLMLDVEVFGIDARASHLVNVGLHATTAALLFLVLMTLSGAPWRALAVAALFAVHPLRVESVAWVTERKDVLSGLLFVVTLAAYAGYCRRRGWRAAIVYTAAVVTYACGLMAKPMLVSVPLLLLLVDFWPLARLAEWSASAPLPPAVGSQPPSQRIRSTRAVSLRRALAEKIPFVILAAASCAITIASQRAGGALVGPEVHPFDERVANACVAYVTYLAKTLWPTGLACFYPYTRPPWYAPAAAALLVAVTGLALFDVKRRPYLAVGWLWFVVALVPVIGLVQAGAQSMADRFTYLPHVGLLVALVWWTADVLERRPATSRLLPWLAAAVVAGACATTYVQLQTWRNSETLLRRALAVTRDNFLAHANLGSALAEQGRYEEADEHYREAVRLRPSWPVAQNNMGNVYARAGDYEAAAYHYRNALAVRPELTRTRYNLGLALHRLGQLDQAIEQYRLVIAADPTWVDGHYSLAHALLSAGQAEAARAQAEAGLELAPDREDVRALVARIDGEVASRARAAQVAELLVRARKLAGTERYDEAVSAYEQALQLNPAIEGAHYELGVTLSAAGDRHGAAREFRLELVERPAWPPAALELAWILATDRDPSVRNGTEAVRLAEAAASASPGDAATLDVLAAAYAEDGRFDAAIEAAERALAANDDREWAAGVRERLAGYRRGRAYRVPERVPET